MSDGLTIAVGSRALLASLQTHAEVARGEVKLLSPDDIRTVLESVLAQQPSYVALDREFLRSTRGTAMIERLRADPGFSKTEILVVDGTSVTLLGALASDTTPAAGSDPQGGRRVPRIRIKSGVEVQVDGTGAQLIDLSTLGAQVVSPSPLKPNQRVRFSLPGDTTSRLVGTVAWVSFELPKGRPAPQYRAGLEFNNPDSGGLQQFCVTNAFTESGAPG